MPRWMYAAVAVAVAAAIAVVEIGSHDQHSRRIPTVDAAVIWRTAPQTKARLIVRVGPREANRPASRLNGLPQSPSGATSCGADLADVQHDQTQGVSYRLCK